MKNLAPDTFINGEKIYLRAFENKDLEMVNRLENHPDPRETLFYALPTNTENQQEKINNLVKDPNTILLTICDKADDQPVGQTALVRIDWVGKMGTFYLGIADKENWSKGYGSETVKLMLDYSFNELNFNRVQLHVAVKNSAAVKIYKRYGFLVEGKLREAMYQHGKYWDFYLMGILKKDWEKLNKKDINKK
jgi:RimJ/RimL family protein N-acetyltransferase